MVTPFEATDAVGAYQIESSFDAGDDTWDTPSLKTFGRNVTIDTFEASNNGQQLFQFSNRAPKQIVEQNFEGTWSVSFVLSSFEFLEIYDSNFSKGGTSFSLQDPQSFEMVVQRNDSGNDITRVATGCVAQSLSFSVSLDGTVSVSMDGVYANEYKRTGNSQSQPMIQDSKDAINFADVALDYNGTSFDLPRGVDLSIDNTITLLSVLGQRTAKDFTVGALTGTVDTTQAVEVDTTSRLEEMYGTANSVGTTVSDDTTVKVTMDNGISATSGQVKAVFELDGFANSYSESGLDIQEDVVEATASHQIKNFTITVNED